MKPKSKFESLFEFVEQFRIPLFLALVLGIQVYRTTEEVVVARTPTCTQTATETLHGLFQWNFSPACPVEALGLSATAKKLLEEQNGTVFGQDGNILDRFLKKD
jgi:hypothetical protein